MLTATHTHVVPVDTKSPTSMTRGTTSFVDEPFGTILYSYVFSIGDG